MFDLSTLEKNLKENTPLPEITLAARAVARGKVIS